MYLNNVGGSPVAIKAILAKAIPTATERICALNTMGYKLINLMPCMETLPVAFTHLVI